MWSIFILPVALLGVVSAFLGMVNGGTILVITVAADQWQRSRGYKSGEGVFTDREGGHVFGLRVAKESTDLGQFLWGMTEAFPDMFEEFSGTSFDLTESEGEFLRCLVQSAQLQLKSYLDLVSQEGDETEETTGQFDLPPLEELELRERQLRAALAPVVKYLKEVPSGRVRKCP